MDEGHEKFLFEMFDFMQPRDGDETAIKKFGIECGDGWLGLIVRLCRKLTGLKMRNFRVVQIKEKFGTLRFYFDRAPRRKIKEIINFINEAEIESSHTCEVCGAPGRLKQIRWLLLTRCNGCTENKYTG